MQAELAPDKEKLVAFGTAINNITVPVIKSKEAQRVLTSAINSLADIVDTLNEVKL